MHQCVPKILKEQFTQKKKDEWRTWGFLVFLLPRVGYLCKYFSTFHSCDIKTMT